MEIKCEDIAYSVTCLSEVINCHPVPTFVLDNAGMVIIWNRAMENLTGITSEYMLGKMDYEHSTPFFGERKPSIANYILDPGLDAGGDYVFLEKNGDTASGKLHTHLNGEGKTSFLCIASAIRDVDGNITHVIESFCDITRQENELEIILGQKKEIEKVVLEYQMRIKEMTDVQTDLLKTQEQLIETNNRFEFSEEKYSKTVHLGPVIITVSRLSDGRYIEVSGFFLKHMGYSRDEVIGHSSVELKIWADPLDRERVINILKKDGVVRDMEFPFRSKQGFIYIMLYSAEIITIAGELHLVSVAIDITERKKAEEERKLIEQQFLQSQKMETVGRLAGGIAHDFNNLLTAILGYVELSMMKLQPDSPVYSNLIIISQASKSAADLTRRILAFSRRHIIESVVIDLNEMIDRMEKMLDRLIGENIKLVTNPGATNARIKADQGQIEQIIVNLTVNARDAMPGGGLVTLETGNVYHDPEYCRMHPYVVTGDYVMLSIKDTGTGISDEVMKHLFEPFFTTKTKDKGTGLGLAMVYGSVKQNGGSIEVFSEEKKGTNFRLYFPVFAGEVEKQEKKQDDKIFFKGSETILLVEDNRLVRGFAVDVLKQAGYDVIEALSGEDALEKVKKGNIDITLVMTDIMLPGINGRLLAAEIDHIIPGIRVLYTSGYSGDLISYDGVPDDGIFFIAKPYSTHGLLKKIREVLDK